MNETTADILFTPAVREIQTKYGSREAMAKLEARGHWTFELTDDVIAFIRTRDSFYFGTSSRSGRPHIQHRGGPPGFIEVLDNRTLLWPEFNGNRQYISAGNLSENDQAFMFLMDYNRPRRIKLWGRAQVIEKNDPMFCAINKANYAAKIERAVCFFIEARDENCRKYITPRYSEEALVEQLQQTRARLEALEAELARIRQLS